MTAFARPRRQPRVRVLAANLFFGAMGLTALLLFVGLVGAAAERAYAPERVPPTPTVPPIEPNSIYVSALFGTAEYTSTGSAPASLQAGAVLPLGDGIRIRTHDSGRVRLGLADRTILFLDANTEIDLVQMAGPETGLDETIVRLQRGRLLASTDLGDDRAAPIARAQMRLEIRDRGRRQRSVEEARELLGRRALGDRRGVNRRHPDRPARGRDGCSPRGGSR